MKKFLLLMMMSCFAAVLYGQTLIDGDYRTAKTTGNWSELDMWEKRSGGTWSLATSLPTATSNVYVQSGHAVTVDIAQADCKDLQLSVDGILAIGANNVNVNGKIRAFSNPAVTGAADGDYSTSSISLVPTMISTTGTGKLNFVGGSRAITEANEWTSSGTTNNASFALDANATVTSATGFKFKNIEIISGTVSSDGFISPVETGLTIKSGAKLISSRSGLVIGNNSTTKTGTFTIEDGATLELTGSAPTMAVTSFVNNGTVIYSRAGTQTFLARGGDATGTDQFNNYKNLVLAGTSSKTPAAPITVSALLKLMGTASIAATSTLTLTMLNGTTVERNGTVSTPIPSTAGAIFYGTSATDLVNVFISNSVSNSNELQSSPTPGKIGTLTVDAGVNYTITGGRTVTNIVNNGIITLTPTTTFTFTVNGGISGSGTMTGNTNASLTVGGTDQDAVLLKFTNGSANLNRLTVNRTGTLPSITLGSSLTLNENLVLTNGVLNIQPGFALTMSGANALTGSAANYVNTQTAGASVGKLVVNNLTTSKVMHVGHNGNYLPVTLNPTSASTFEINVFAGATADATPNGAALTADQKSRMVDAVWNINRTSGTGNVGVTFNWPDGLQGATFAGFADAQIGVAAYTAGNFGQFNGPGNATANTASITTSVFTPFIVGEANTTLPLSLISFLAKQNLNTVRLDLKTSDEKDLKNYILQHKKDDGYETIQTFAPNNKPGIFNYSFTHATPLAGTNYYRLLAVDLDGTTYTFDQKVKVSLNNAMNVYPNPAVGNVITVSGVVKGDVIRLQNIQGQVIAKKVASGSSEQIDVQAIAVGTYIVSIENEGKTVSTKKIIKI